MIKELRVWPSSFEEIINGTKTFEIRNNSYRDFKLRDEIIFKEFEPGLHGGYTGREQKIEITYILSGGRLGIDADKCIFSFKLIK